MKNIKNKIIYSTKKKSLNNISGRINIKKYSTNNNINFSQIPDSKLIFRSDVLYVAPYADSLFKKYIKYEINKDLFLNTDLQYLSTIEEYLRQIEIYFDNSEDYTQFLPDTISEINLDILKLYCSYLNKIDFESDIQIYNKFLDHLILEFLYDIRGFNSDNISNTFYENLMVKELSIAKFIQCLLLEKDNQFMEGLLGLLGKKIDFEVDEIITRLYKDIDVMFLRKEDNIFNINNTPHFIRNKQIQKREFHTTINNKKKNDNKVIGFLKKENLDLSKVHYTHKILDDNLNYKLENLQKYPLIDINDFMKGESNYVDWRNTLYYILNYKLEPNISYSLAIKKIVYSHKDNKLDSVTFGKHLLVTNQINFSDLVTTIEGTIERQVFNFNSPTFTSKEDNSEKGIIQFLYREITDSEKIYKSISNIKYIDTLKSKQIDFKSTEKSIIDQLNKINEYLKLIPLNFNIYKDGSKFLVSNKHRLSDGRIGLLYKYNESINIFLYGFNSNKTQYSGMLFKNNKEYLIFTDLVYYNKEDYELIRKFDNNILYIKNSNIQFIENELTSKLIQKKKRSFSYDDKYITFDIECYLESKNENVSQFIPYSCKWYTQNDSKFYYTEEFTSWEEMVIKSFKDIKSKYNNYTIYVHNLSNFDSIFILKVLSKIYKINSINKEGKFISINIHSKDNKNKFNIKIKDSYLLLPLSLEKLIDGFSIDTKKLIFPYKFVNKNNLNYIGEFPEYNYFYDNFNQESYEKYLESSNKYIKNKWNLRKETAKYINNDVQSLYEITQNFGKKIYELEKINITDVVSISSLALNIFLTNYYDPIKTPIYIPRKKQYDEIKESYFGGRVEIFKTYGENLYIYDVNSLYPYVMLQDMPVGKIIKSSDTILENYFGFCYATVTVPYNTYNPILSYRDEFGNVFNPVGTWTSMFTSEILKKAIKVNNVKVKIHYGYKFDRGKDLFKDYINRYFSLKQESAKTKNDTMRFISKLMLNSLYGRWGLKYQEYKTKFVSSKEYKEYSLKYNILENILIDEANDLEFIKYTLEPSSILKDIDMESYLNLISKENYNEDFIDRSLPIAAMITSYATCFMYDFLNISNNECYMTDTDSLFLKYPLESKNVGEALGQFRFLGKAKKGYFISPKLYCLVMDNGEIIKKSKGIENTYLTENDYIEMLYGLELTKNNIFRFNKNMTNLEINYNKTNFSISSNLLKREPIYSLNNLVINTKPLQVSEKKIIKKDYFKLNFGLELYNPNRYSIIKI
jgi:hypothetical protein